ncbi:MAG: ABC transporter permease [Williamsia sp.]|nr:ABC transporter permease [Williamsia sp.]
MLQNYLIIALRNLKKFRFTSFINIFGLTTGLTCCLLILTYLLYESSFDRYNKEAKNVYRVERTFLNPENGALSLELGAVSPPFAPLLQSDFKDIKKITRFLPASTTPMKWEDKIFNEKKLFFADENLFDVFDVTLLKGNPAKALTDPFTVILSEETARKYFGDGDPLNKVVRFNNQFDCKVSGIYKAFPPNAHLHPDLLLSFNTLRDPAVYGEENLRTNWGNNAFYTYVLLPDGYNHKTLEAQFPAFIDRHMPNDRGRFKQSEGTFLTLRPLTDIHLYSHKDDEMEENGDIKRIYTFSAIALFILLIACINYMNLSTARSVLRAKEIGVRKVVGARKWELIGQFLTESIVVCWVATLLALLLTWISLPWLNQLSGQTLSLSTLLNWKIIGLLMLIPFITGILAGIYPSLFLSSFQPIRVLKGVLKIGGGNISFRKVLVVAQFAISIILIISTAIVFQQLHFMQQKSLGFNKDRLLTIRYNGALNNTYESFRTSLLADASVREVGRSSRIPSGRLLDAMDSQIDRGDSLAPSKADIKFINADEHFLSTYGVHMVEGRGFRGEQGTDTASFLINEEAVKALGLKSNREAIGKPFRYGGRPGTLVGVFNSFHFESMHQRILPLVVQEAKPPFGYANISIKVAGNIPAAISHIEKTWKQFAPEVPFDYTFLDDRFARLYESEQRQGAIFSLFSCIAIFIACLGLFGLSAFTITQRMKEIGIRKVLGASTRQIVQLLSKDFLLLVLIAAVIAFPVAWYTMNSWLQEFAYRIPISAWVFAAAAIIAALVALVTIGIQAVKAALTNPVQNLRTE